MGMFDNITCEYPLPGDAPADVKAWTFQTKDTPAQMLEHYRITADGKLQHRDVRYEDRSDSTKEGIERLVGMLTPIYGDWIDENDFVGKLSFYGSNVVASGPATYTKDGEDSIWVEYEAVIVDGQLIRIKEIEYKTEPAWKSEGFLENMESVRDKTWWDAKRQEFEAYQASEIERRKNNG